MKAVFINRILLLLGFIGLFIAGFMSIAHRLNVDVPCGPGGGCSQVTSHESAYWFGIPVAYFGVLGYATLTALAMIRALKGLERTRALVMPGYFVAVIGTIGSLYLQYQALFIIRATCTWCLSSALVMVVTLILYAVLAQIMDSRQEVPADTKAFPIVVGLMLTVFVALGASGVQLYKTAQESAKNMLPQEVNATVEALIPKDAHIYGDKNARITIVEFADMYCPACRRSGVKLKEVVDSFPGKVRIVYRHFPLVDRHPLALSAALISEAAADEDKFWEFLMTVVRREGTEEIGESALYDIAREVGLDADKIKQRVENEKDPVWTRVQRDLALANESGLQVTPTFIMMIDDEVKHIASSNDVFQKLDESPFKEIINGG